MSSDDIDPGRIKAEVEQDRRAKAEPPPTPGNPFREAQIKQPTNPPRKIKPKEGESDEQ